MADDAIVSTAKRRRREDEEVVQAIVHCEALWLCVCSGFLMAFRITQPPTRPRWVRRILNC